jgi:hypothetical protein
LRGFDRHRRLIIEIGMKNVFRMNKLLQIFGILLFLSCSIFAQERVWKTFSPETGAWSILAPGEMRHDPDALETLSTKGGYSYSDANGFFAVVYEDSPKWQVALYKPFINSHYKKIRNSFVKSSKGELLKDEKFTNAGKSGREFLVKIPDGRIMNNEGQLITRYRVGRFRIFFHGNRCYMLLAVLPENEINSFAVDNYFNSFVAK